MSRSTRLGRVVLALLCCACMALAPVLAEARAGSSFGGHPSSFGSRGLRSWEYNGAQPLSRAPSSAGGAGGRAMPGPGYGGSLLQRHPFLTGLAGGLFGAWLFGHAAGAAGLAGAAGTLFGTLLWLALIGFLLWFAVRLLRMRGFSNGWPRPAAGGLGLRRPSPAAGRFRGRDVNLADADLGAFQRLHAAIQSAWSAGDLERLRRLMTPQMFEHFAEELARNTSRGLRNVVGEVELVNGELREAWDEGNRQYATAFLRWRAVDYMVRLGAPAGGPDALVAGDPRSPEQFEEVWTFVRRPGGPWLLTAIQQV